MYYVFDSSPINALYSRKLLFARFFSTESTFLQNCSHLSSRFSVSCCCCFCCCSIVLARSRAKSPCISSSICVCIMTRERSIHSVVWDASLSSSPSPPMTNNFFLVVIVAAAAATAAPHPTRACCIDGRNIHLFCLTSQISTVFSLARSLSCPPASTIQTSRLSSPTMIAVAAAFARAVGISHPSFLHECDLTFHAYTVFK
mmetsp:Transcript_28431/g.66007  ORF Transcript_28431/g.66007 Transcript_28431/m.66007 type:complete len:201 (+) Transcript_28431:1735-2337(+)